MPQPGVNSVDTVLGKTGYGSVPETEEDNIKNARAQERQARLELLYDIAPKVSSFSETAKALVEILGETQRLLRAAAVSLLMFDEPKQGLYRQTVGGKAPMALRQIKLGADSGIAGWVAHRGEPLVINDAAGDQRFNEDIDGVSGLATGAVMVVPVIRAQKVIGVLEAINKTGGGAFDERDLRIFTGLASTEALTLLVSAEAMAVNNFKRCHALPAGEESAIEPPDSTADTEDPVCGHARRVVEYSLLAAHSLSFPVEELWIIELGALLHDLGKIGTNNILPGTGSSSDEERHLLRQHPLKGAGIVSEIRVLERAKGIVLYHHEDYDGTGYPEGLKGENIPLGARLVAVADAFDNMTTNNSGRPSLNATEAMAELTKGVGHQFCPVAVEAFISGLKKAGKVDDEAAGTRVVEEDAELAKKEAEQAAREKAKKEAEEARKAVEAEKLAKKEAERTTKEQAKREAGQVKKAKETQKAARKLCPDIYKGGLRLMVLMPSPVDSEQINQFMERLQKVENLKTVMVGGSLEEGTTVVVSVADPSALGSVFSGIAEKTAE